MLLLGNARLIVVGVPGLQGAHIGRLFDEEAITRVDESLADQVEGLL